MAAANGLDDDGFEAEEEDVESGLNGGSRSRRDDLKKQITEATLTAITESLTTPYDISGRDGQQQQQHGGRHASGSDRHFYVKNRPSTVNHEHRHHHRSDGAGTRSHGHGGSLASARNAHWELETDPRHAAAIQWRSTGDIRQQQGGLGRSASSSRARPAVRAAKSAPRGGLERYDEELGGHRPSTTSAAAMPSRKTSKRLSVRANPFSARAGKKLTWTNVNMTLTGDGGKCCSCAGFSKKMTNGEEEKKERSILDGVWGEVPEREVTAILGPSGAGKTSLLNILAGRAKSRGNLKVTADVRLNNYAVNPAKQEVRKQIAFVPQDDSLQITATPREAIRFSAKMRLSSKTTEKELDDLVDCMLEELGLTGCSDTIVGGHMIKGISGGERKRTSVGVELVVKPALVFLDEPTSGLDSFSAVQLIQVLKKVANAGSSVLFTIHQPASEVFNSFDHVILMNAGRVMYEGEVSDVPDYFGARGHPVPSRYNPADWIMNVAQVCSIPELDKAGYFPTDQRQLTQREAFRADEEEGRDALGITKHTNGNGGRKETRIGFFSQVGMLFLRELQAMKRNKKPLMARFVFTTVMSTLVGILFLGIGGMDQSDFLVFQAHFGSLVLVLMLSMFGTAMPSLLAFPEERPVFMREYSTDHYSVSAYFVSRLTTEAIVTFLQMLVSLLITYFLIDLQMPFGYMMGVLYMLAMTSTAVAVLLGCSVEDPKMATEFLPILFVPQLLFAGFFVSTELIPSWLRWAQYLCSLTYALRLALLAEFGDCAKEDTQPNNCKAGLDNSGAEEDLIWMYWLILCCLFLVFRVGALLILRKKAQKFF